MIFVIYFTLLKKVRIFLASKNFFSAGLGEFCHRGSKVNFNIKFFFVAFSFSSCSWTFSKTDVWARSHLDSLRTSRNIASKSISCGFSFLLLGPSVSMCSKIIGTQDILQEHKTGHHKLNLSGENEWMIRYMSLSEGIYLLSLAFIKLCFGKKRALGSLLVQCLLDQYNKISPFGAIKGLHVTCQDYLHVHCG